MQQNLKDKFKYWQFVFYLPIYLVFFFLAERNVSDVTIINIPFDDCIPFVEEFIVPYMLWFPFMLVAIIYVFFKDKREFFAMAWNLIIGMSLFIVVSFVFPNGLELRPGTMPRDNIFIWMVEYLHKIDTPTNVLPSIHVYNSLACGISLGRVLWRRSHKITAIASYAMAVLITLSTMFVKQHSVVDVVSALALSGLCFLLLGRFYKHEADDKSDNV
jgi:membrane-associated phospholipid phosphatase